MLGSRRVGWKVVFGGNWLFTIVFLFLLDHVGSFKCEHIFSERRERVVDLGRKLVVTEVSAGSPTSVMQSSTRTCILTSCQPKPQVIQPLIIIIISSIFRGWWTSAGGGGGVGGNEVELSSPHSAHCSVYSAHACVLKDVNCVSSFGV